MIVAYKLWTQFLGSGLENVAHHSCTLEWQLKNHAENKLDELLLISFSHFISYHYTLLCIWFFSFLFGLAMKILENLNLKVLNLAIHYHLCIRIIRPQQQYCQNYHQCEKFFRPNHHDWTVELWNEKQSCMKEV